jgi:O-antigen/teichoic acid export membrane protein
VVNFTAIRTVTRVLLQGISTLTQAASVELTSSLAKEKWELYMRWVKILTVCVVGASVCGCIGLYLFGPWVISLWTHGKVSVSATLLTLFGISVALQAGWTLYGTLVYTANKHHLQCYIYFGVTLLALAIGWCTIGHFGFGFVPILMIAPDFVLLIVTLVLCVRNLKQVNFFSMVALFHPNFYWNKIRWVIARSRGEGPYFWPSNR